MPKPIGLFDSFENLDKITPEAIAEWLKPSPPPLLYLENYLANKLLYPQTVPVTLQDLNIELAILREALRVNSSHDGKQANPFLSESPFINFNLKKILIPQHFLNFVPDLKNLVWVFIDGLLLDKKREKGFEDIWTIIITADLDEVVGTVILPRFDTKIGQIQLDLLGKTYTIKLGSLTVVPCIKQKCQILFKSSESKLLGKNDLLIEVYGGRLGILVDGRV